MTNGVGDDQLIRRRYREPLSKATITVHSIHSIQCGPWCDSSASPVCYEPTRMCPAENNNLCWRARAPSGPKLRDERVWTDHLLLHADMGEATNDRPYNTRLRRRKRGIVRANTPCGSLTCSRFSSGPIMPTHRLNPGIVSAQTSTKVVSFGVSSQHRLPDCRQVAAASTHPSLLCPPNRPHPRSAT